MWLWHEKVCYLGHLISGDGSKLDPEKVAAILKMQKPTDIKSMQRFIGFVNYLAKFLPNISTVSEPLQRLSCKNASWTWQSEQETAFKKTKQLVTAAPVLQFYDVTKEVTTQCDTSSSGLGAVMMQDGHPIASASKALTTTARNYAQIEKECWALYLHAQNLINIYIWPNNGHNTYRSQTIFKKALQAAPKQLQCMLMKLQKYNLQVQYKGGAEMHIANFLSRTFTDRKGEEQKQQQNASKGQADDMDILAIEDNSYWPTTCANSRAHKTRQSTASTESDNFRWNTPMYQRILVMQRQTGSSQMRLSSEERAVPSFQKYCN